MRDDDGVDQAGREPGGVQVGVHEAGGVGDLPGGAGVDQHQLRAGVHQERGEEIGSTLGGRKAAASAAFTSAPLALRTNLSSIGRYQMPS